jgi:hypothetical protein
VRAAAATVNNETLGPHPAAQAEGYFFAGLETALNFGEFRRSLVLMLRAIADRFGTTPFTSDGRLNCERLISHEDFSIW